MLHKVCLCKIRGTKNILKINFIIRGAVSKEDSLFFYLCNAYIYRSKRICGGKAHENCGVRAMAKGPVLQPIFKKYHQCQAMLLPPSLDDNSNKRFN